MNCINSLTFTLKICAFHCVYITSTKKQATEEQKLYMELPLKDLQFENQRVFGKKEEKSFHRISEMESNLRSREQIIEWSEKINICKCQVGS